MESNDKVKEINIADYTLFYFDDIIKIEDFDLAKITIDERTII